MGPVLDRKWMTGCFLAAAAACFGPMAIRADEPGLDPVIVVEVFKVEGTEGAPGRGRLVAFLLKKQMGGFAAVTVNIAWSGSATNGQDYAEMPSTLTIPQGATKAVVVVQITDDTAAEGGESVSLTILPGDYEIGASSQAGGVIADNDAGGGGTGGGGGGGGVGN